MICTITDTSVTVLHARNPVSHVHQQALCGVQCGKPAAVSQAGLGRQITDFFGGLFDTNLWPDRWHCGSWSDFHGWMYIVSDVVIWASYFAIPVLLIHMLRKRRDLPFPKVLWLFVAFIILCGSTHLLDAIIFWWPAYRLSALVRFITAAVSAITVFVLYKVMPMILSLRTVKDLEIEILDRTEVARQLAASEFLLKEAGRIGRMGAWEYDTLTRKTTCGTTVYDIFEIPYSVEIQHEDMYDYFAEPSRQQLYNAVSNAYMNGTPWDLDLQVVTISGTQLWVRSCGEVVYNDAGRMSNIRGVFFDIDKQKTSEIALNRSHEMLFQSHQQLKTFTHILSHNIRNHASNISLLTDLVDTATLDENNTDLFEKISKVSLGLNDTLNDLSEAIRIRENHVVPEVLFFQVAVAHVCTVLESEMQAAGTEITYDFQVATVMYPKLYLESIMMNLISNAVKYRRADVPPVISLRTYHDKNGHTVMECQDNGLGLDLQLHGSRVFGLYKTFHNHKEAHGVGLFLVKTQVESQGGSITLESKPNEGATFIITF